MKTQILQSKIYTPQPSSNVVPRERLIHLLNQGLHHKLCLISAPAGYGKTTLLSDWIAQQNEPCAWISLDEKDNEPRRFFSYLAASLQSIQIEIEENLLSKLQDSEIDLTDDFLLPLLNQISLFEGHYSLVLDDYHLIQNNEIHSALIFFLENLPGNTHLIIASRSDPPLQLAKIRAQGKLCEIRVHDLRFSAEEAIRFLNQSLDLGLTPEDVSILTEKTEGWIVGLQLAGISLQKHPDKHAFVITFAGDDRYIADYLLDEALGRQPPHIQKFLLQTSILERLRASLCDAVTGGDNSQTILMELEKANLFLIPLDNQRIWFRYHHLFADLLQNRLKRYKDNSIQDLHIRASIWFKENYLLADAINHALAANETQQIVHLTEELAVYKMDAGELRVLMSWLEHQPASLFLEHPWLLVARTWVYFNTGDYPAVESGLSEIEDILFNHSYSADLMVRIMGHLATIRSYMAELRDEPETAIQHAEAALMFLPEEDVQLRAFVAIRWANCLAWIGDYQEAIQALKEAGNAAKLAGDGQIAVSALSEMAMLQVHIGQLKQAVKNITEVKNYAEMLGQQHGRRLPAMGQLYRQFSSILLERNLLTEAEYYAQEAVQICQQWGEKESLYAALIGLARVHFFNKEYEKFEQLFDQGTKIAKQISFSYVSFIQNLKNHYLLLRGEIQAAENWSREQGLSRKDDIDYDRRLEYLNYARVLTAGGKHAEALEIMEKLLKMAEEADARYHTINYKVIQATILHRCKQPDSAMKALEEALAIASPEGYVRSFLDEGEIVAHLLYQAAQREIFPEYCQLLLDEFSKEIQVSTTDPAKPAELVEPLSERELEVLRYIAQGLTNQEIAQALFLSLYTVKSHARNIFSKLGVKNRTEAVSKSRLYGILPQN